jgi:membrane protein implicated in regulation of membrane protease activity
VLLDVVLSMAEGCGQTVTSASLASVNPDDTAWLFGGGAVALGVTIALSILASLLCTIAPIAAIFWFVRKRKTEADTLRAESARWPGTVGRVLKSRVEVQGGDHASVRPYVLYEYMVAGQRYEGQQIRAGDKFMTSYSSRQAYDTVDLYPVGSEVTVFYDPSNPAESALSR